MQIIRGQRLTRTYHAGVLIQVRPPILLHQLLAVPEALYRHDTAKVQDEGDDGRRRLRRRQHDEVPLKPGLDAERADEKNGGRDPGHDGHQDGRQDGPQPVHYNVIKNGVAGNARRRPGTEQREKDFICYLYNLVSRPRILA